MPEKGRKSLSPQLLRRARTGEAPRQGQQPPRRRGAGGREPGQSTDANPRADGPTTALHEGSEGTLGDPGLMTRAHHPPSGTQPRIARLPLSPYQTPSRSGVPVSRCPDAEGGRREAGREAPRCRRRLRESRPLRRGGRLHSASVFRCPLPYRVIIARGTASQSEAASAAKVAFIGHASRRE